MTRHTYLFTTVHIVTSSDPLDDEDRQQIERNIQANAERAYGEGGVTTGVYDGFGGPFIDVGHPLTTHGELA